MELLRPAALAIANSTIARSWGVQVLPFTRWQGMHQTLKFWGVNMYWGNSLAGKMWSTLRALSEPHCSHCGDCLRSFLLSRVHRAVCK